MRRVLYAVYGSENYLAEAMRSARSLRARGGDFEIVVYTTPESAQGLETRVFDRVEIVEFKRRANMRIDFALKLHAITNGLSSETLFLDSDTYVCGNLDAAWALLQRFDVLACHAPYRRRFRYENYREPDFVSDVPAGFCEMNTGVIFLRDNNRTRSMVQAWANLYAQAPLSGDQYLFMDAVYNSDVNLYVLPSEYNYRFTIPGFASDDVKIVHAHHQHPKQIAAQLNETESPRVSVFRDGELEILAPPSAAPKRRVG